MPRAAAGWVFRIALAAAFALLSAGCDPPSDTPAGGDASAADHSDAGPSTDASAADALVTADVQVDVDVPGALDDAGVVAPIACGPGPSDGDAGIPELPYGSDAGAPAETGLRLVAPLSWSVVTSNRPLLRWARAPSVAGVRVSVCSDRACAAVVQRVDATGAELALPAALGPGVYFWNVSSADGSQRSATWSLVVGGFASSVQSSRAAPFDVDGDAYADALVTTASGVAIHRGGGAGLATTPWARLGPALAGAADAGDLDGDGRSDLLAGAYVVYGAATPAGLRVGCFPVPASLRTRAGVGDVDGDGFGDVVEGHASSTVTWAAFHPGTAAGVRIEATARAASGAASLPGGWLVQRVGDLDADGYADVVSSDDYFSSTGTGYAILPGSARPFTRARSQSFSFVTTQVNAADAAGDVNGDGRADYVANEVVLVDCGDSAPAYSGTVATVTGTDYPADSACRWQGARHHYNAHLVPVGDLNGDGFTDVFDRDAGALDLGGRAGIDFAHPIVTARAVARALGDVNRDGFDDVLLTDGSVRYGVGDLTRF